jgi:hypothetical protein
MERGDKPKAHFWSKRPEVGFCALREEENLEMIWRELK